MAMPLIGGKVGKFRRALRQKLGMEDVPKARGADAHIAWDYPASGGTQLTDERGNGKESRIQASG